MNRLTTRRPDGSIETTGKTYSEFHVDYVDYTRVNDRYDIRLAEYEDTGLTPEEIKELTVQLKDSIEEARKQGEYACEMFDGLKTQRQRAIKAEEQAVALKEGLKRIKTNIEEYHPHNTLALPKFRFAKEFHDIAIQALKELEV